MSGGSGSGSGSWSGCGSGSGSGREWVCVGVCGKADHIQEMIDDVKLVSLCVFRARFSLFFRCVWPCGCTIDLRVEMTI